MRYTTAYGVLLAALLAVSGSIVHQYSRADAVMSVPYYAAMPSMTFEELHAQRETLFDTAQKATDPNTYYTEFLPAARRLGTIAQANIMRAPERTMDILRLERFVVSNHNVILQVQQGYFQRFTQRRMAELSPRTMEREQPPHEPAGPYWLRWYLVSLMLAVVFFALRIKEKGLALWLEALQPHQLLLAVMGWPVFMWKYPRHTPAVQVRWALRYATLVLGTLLSGGVGAAKASERTDGGKKEDPKRKWALVVRGIASRQVSEGPPNPEYGFRMHLTAPPGRFFEGAGTTRKDFWSLSPTVGQMLWRSGPSSAAVVTGASFTSTGARSVSFGTEILYIRKRWQVVMPTCLVERRLEPSPLTSFSMLMQATMKAGKWSAGPEFQLRTAHGARPSIAVGGVVTYAWGKPRVTFEEGLFRSPTAWRARTRLIRAWSF